jgi:hypothetical protein
MKGSSIMEIEARSDTRVNNPENVDCTGIRGEGKVMNRLHHAALCKPARKIWPSEIVVWLGRHVKMVSVFFFVDP